MVYEFPPLRVDTENFIRISNELFSYARSVNVNRDVRGYLEIGRDDFLAKLELPVESSDFGKFPRIAYKASLSVSAQGGLVNQINVRFSDYSRQVDVSGTNNDYVIGFINTITQKLDQYTTIFGGIRFRITVAAIFFIISWIFSGIICFMWQKLSAMHTFILTALILLLTNAMVFLPDWNLIFPGFLVTADNRGFLERYSPEFGAAGLLATFFLPALSLWHRWRNRRANR